MRLLNRSTRFARIWPKFRRTTAACKVASSASTNSSPSCWTASLDPKARKVPLARRACRVFKASLAKQARKAHKVRAVNLAQWDHKAQKVSKVRKVYLVPLALLDRKAPRGFRG